MSRWTSLVHLESRARRFTLALLVVLTACALAAGYSWWQKPQHNALRVLVRELPSGAAANVTVRGPDGFERRVTANQTFDDIPTGRYTLSIAPVRGAKADVYPTRPAVTASVESVGTATAEALYANVVPHTTKVLDSSQLGLVGDVAGSRLVLESDAALAVGDVIVSGVGPKTPNGLIRRVTSVRHDDRGRLVIGTKQASLRDALPKAKIDFQDVRPDSPASEPAPASQAMFSSGVASNRNAQVLQTKASEPGVQTGSDGTFTISTLLNSETIIEGLTFECSAALTASPLEEISLGGQKPGLGEFTADWDWSGVNRVRYAITLKEDFHIKVKMPAVERQKCAFKFKEPDPPVPVATFTLMVGPIPVVITMEVNLVAALEGTLKSDLSFDFTQKAKVSAGMEWRGGRTTPIASFENEFKLNKGPTVATEATAKAGLRIGTKIYGVAGPYLDITPGYKIAEVDEFGGQQKAELKGGLYTAAGIEFDPWLRNGEAIMTAEISDLYHVEKVLWSHVWNSTPTPSPSKTDPGKRAPCPSREVIRQAIKKQFTVPVAPGAPHLGKFRCWNGWVAAVWSVEPATDNVDISVFKRDQSRLDPAVTLVPVMGDEADPDWLRDCRSLKDLKAPAGVTDFVGCER